MCAVTVEFRESVGTVGVRVYVGDGDAATDAERRSAEGLSREVNRIVRDAATRSSFAQKTPAEAR